MNVPPQLPRGEATRAELRQAARKLFATRGIAAVGLREVAEAAGQRNTSAAHYHFGSKDDLLRALLVEGARKIDDERQALLDAAEAVGPVTMEQVVDALVVPSLNLSLDPGRAETWFRFMVNVMAERRPLFEDAIVGQHARGYERCVAHVRRLLGALPRPEVDRRLVFATVALQSIVAAREAALDGASPDPHPFWGRPDVTAGIGRTVVAILGQGEAIE